ncbi:MAG: hypothetical protein KF778_14150 [Rhodocyclaceae bacterium]|nr:hypothetical protein [Rhodocyclaceae bacterium]
MAVLAANLSGAGAAFSYTDRIGLTVGTVGSLSGVSTNTGNVTLTALNAGDLSRWRKASARPFERQARQAHRAWTPRPVER